MTESAAAESDPRESDLSDSQRPLEPARRIALINQKGGVGKTTTTVNLGAALAQKGQRVLLIDLDPQAHLTLHVGVDPENLDLSLYHLMTDDSVSPYQIIQQIDENLGLLPAEVNLAGLESELAEQTQSGQAQQTLWQRCEPLIRDGHHGPFNYVLIDCPPSLGLLTVNGLALAQQVIVPMQAHFLALQGLSKLLDTVQWVRSSFNPQLAVAGVILCMHEGNTLLAQEVVSDLDAFIAQSQGQDVPWAQARVFEPAIRRNIKLAECPGFGTHIFAYAPTCAGAADYLHLAESVMAPPPATEPSQADAPAQAPANAETDAQTSDAVDHDQADHEHTDQDPGDRDQVDQAAGNTNPSADHQGSDAESAPSSGEIEHSPEHPSHHPDDQAERGHSS